AQALARLGRADQAALAYLGAVLLSPHVPPWPLDPAAGERGDAAAKQEKWPQAAEDLRLAAHQPSATVQAWGNLPPAQGAAGQDGAWRQSWQEMLHRFESVRDRQLLRDVVFACRTVACEQADAGRVVRLAERLVAGQRNASNLDLLGASLYRAGRLADAART